MMTMTPMAADVGDVLGKLNPFGVLGDAAGKVAAEGWVGICWWIWSAGLWVLRFVLGLVDRFGTIDLTADGPGAALYRVTWWMGGSLVVTLIIAQIGVAIFRRDGKSLGTAAIGSGQFIVVLTCWIAYANGVVTGAQGLSHALMKSLLGFSSWSDWQPLGEEDLSKSGLEGVVATVLAFLALFMWLAAIGHLLIKIATNLALLMLQAMAPIAAAGLVTDFGKAWFWKTFRWFHAAALTPPLVVMVTGVGVQIATAVSGGQVEGIEAQIGTAITAVVMILISVASPMALFRMLAFVDPGTSSGSSMRAGLSAAGGIGGLFGGSAGAASSAASTTDSSGRSQGEQQAGDAASQKATGAIASMAGLYGAGINTVMRAGVQAAAVSSDTLSQADVGDGSYYPDAPAKQSGGQGSGSTPPGARDGDGGGSPPSPPTPRAPSAPGTAGPGAGGGGAAASGGGAASAGGAAAAVPPVV